MPLRLLPSVDELVRRVLPGLPAGTSRPEVVRAARQAIEGLRRTLVSSSPGAPISSREALLDLAAAACLGLLDKNRRPSLRPVINATGVPLHTNLGRARLAPEAVLAMVEASGHTNLEFSLESGNRASRQAHVAGLLRSLTGAEDALVVNNNAAAVWLALRVMARGGTAIISRGEMVEIGESFRLPDIMAEAGVTLREVGTTNRTTIDDYRQALAPAAVIVLVHPSNYRIVGFTYRPDRREIVALAREAGAAVLEDLGSGALFDLSPFGLPGEPTPAASLADGVDAVTFSGDKLLGGPQCGVVAGRSAVVAALRRDPVLRCLRPDKTTLAALEATLRLYTDPSAAASRVPVLKALTEDPGAVRKRASRALRLIRRRLAAAAGASGHPAPPSPSPLASASAPTPVPASLSAPSPAPPSAAAAPPLPASPVLALGPDETEAGGGSLPGLSLGTWVVTVTVPGLSCDELWRRLCLGSPPVVSRRRDGRVILDFRAVTNAEVPALAGAVADALTGKEVQGDGR